MTETAPSLLQALAALLIVLGLIALVAWALKKFAFGGMLVKAATGGTKRLQIIESLWLDARYRLVIIRDGAHEHTLVLGPQTALQLSADTTGLKHG